MQIHIPKPCSESWEQMAPQAKGRYCSACEKTVVDFTRMSDAELIAFLQKSTDQSTCGRLRNDQMDRPLILPVAHPAWYNRLGLLFLGVLGTVTAEGQNRKPVLHPVAISPKPQTAQHPVPVKKKVRKRKRIKMIAIKGRVVSVDSVGVGFIGVGLTKGGWVTRTDSNGYFTLRIPKSRRSHAVLKVAGPGFNTWESRLSQLHLKSLIIAITEMGGPVCTAERKQLIGYSGGLVVSSLVHEEIRVSRLQQMIRKVRSIFKKKNKSAHESVSN